MENNLWIRDEDERLIPLHLNEPQQKVYDKLMAMKAQGKPIRAIVLKARREGVSTLIEALIFHHTATHPNVKSVVLAHTTKSTRELFEMTKLFYDRLPEEVKPKAKYISRNELFFDDPDNPSYGLGSKIWLATAGSDDVGRAPTFHCVHCSEIAYWEHPDEVMLGLKQAVSKNPNSMLIFESTAKGMQGYFWKAWERATDEDNPSGYLPIFLPWFDLPKYRRPLDKIEDHYFLPEDERNGSLLLMPEEQKYKDAYNLGDEQMAWRRWSINEDCDGDWRRPSTWDKFKQEYPANPEEAFLATGRPVFDGEILQGYLLEAKKHPPIAVGKLVVADFDKRTVRFDEQAKQYLSIWEHPIKGEEYLIAADVAEGLRDGSYSVGYVLRRNGLKHVATWRGHTAPDVFGYELDVMARYYNGATVAPEVNNHGLTTITILRQLHNKGTFNKYRIYQRQTYDSVAKKYVPKYGWLTVAHTTRPLMFDGLGAVLRSHQLQTWDETFIRECLSVQYNDKGDPEAPEGGFIDTVIAGCIGVQMNRTLPFKHKPKVEPKYDDRHVEKRHKYLDRQIKRKKEPWVEEW